MNHQEFMQTLETCYIGMSSYRDMRESGRINFLLTMFEEARDFRLMVPLFFFSDFDFRYFIDYNLKNQNLISLFESLYIIIRNISLMIRSTTRYLESEDPIPKYTKPKVEL